MKASPSGPRARAPKRPKRRPWLRTRWQLWRRRGSTRGSAAHGGERGDGRGGRVVLAMDPPQIVALDLLEGDSPLGIHALLAYRTGVAEKEYTRRLRAHHSRLPKHL